jgi:hypothetical protein
VYALADYYQWRGGGVRRLYSPQLICNIYTKTIKILNITIKKTVPPDFSPLFFFLQTTFLVSVGKPSDDFDFFRIFAEIFDFSGASPVSLTPAKQTILL